MPRARLIGLALAMLSITFGSIFGAGPTEAGGGGFCREPTSDARGTNVDLKQNCMIATVLRVDEGATVTFTNRDGVAHTVTGTGSPGTATSFGSFEQITPGQAFTHEFDTNGTYVYYCMLHIGMVGAIVVGDGSGPGSAISGASVPEGDTTTGAAGAAAASTDAGSDTFGARRIALAVLVTGTMLLAAVSVRYAFISRARNMKPSGDGSAGRASSPRI